jgi:hypothetical protein
MKGSLTFILLIGVGTVSVWVTEEDISCLGYFVETASVVCWSEFLTTDPEVPGSIPCASRFYEKLRGLEQGPLSLMRTTEELHEKVAAPV